MRAVLATLVVLLLAGGVARVGASPAAGRPQGTIVYTSNGGGNSEIYSVRADGSLRGQLTRTSAQEANPVFSPDGRRILFVRLAGPAVEPDLELDLWVMNADGSGVHKLASNVRESAWSPDSRRIAYATESGLVVVNVDGRNRHMIRGDTRHPAWSPDGKRLALTLATSGGDRTDLAVVPAAGGRPRTIRRNIGVGPLAWLPRGLISFPGRDDRVTLIRPGGRGARPLRVSADASFFAWAPDGRHFAFVALVGSREHLRVASTAGGRARDITPKGRGSLSELAWSPDGRWIALRRSVTRGDLLVVAADGSSSRRITLPGYPSGGDNDSPSWRPRGATPTRLGRVPVKPAPPEFATRSRLEARGPIIGLAADGPRVAATVDWSPSDCAHVSVWEPGRRPVHVGARAPCPKDVGANVSIDGPVALAGRLVAWTASGGSPSTGVTDLYAATTLRPSTVEPVDEETNTGLTCCGGDFLGDLHGDGGLLAYDTWTECSTTDPDEGAKCRRNGEPWMHTTVMNERLWRIDGLRRKAIRSGRGSFEAAAVDAGRITVLEPSGAVRIVRADGSLVHRLVLPKGEALAAQLSGSQLVVLTPDVLRVYDAATGAAKKTLPLGAAASGRLADLDHGVAVLVDGRTVRLLRLADGHRTTITPPGEGPVFAQLEPSGLFVGYTVRSGKRRGRVDFDPRPARAAPHALNVVWRTART